MTFPTGFNDQVTDAVTQGGVKSVSQSSAVSLGEVITATGQALCNAAYNGTQQLFQAQSAAQTASLMSIVNMLSLDTSTDIEVIRDSYMAPGSSSRTGAGSGEDP